MTEQEVAEKKKAIAKTGIEMIRGVLSLVPALAPTKCSVIPLFSSNAEMVAYLPRVTDALKRLNLAHKVCWSPPPPQMLAHTRTHCDQVDRASQNIGRRYARTDELGIPFGITVRSLPLNRAAACMTLQRAG